jgi:hypothetical protein
VRGCTASSLMTRRPQDDVRAMAENRAALRGGVASACRMNGPVPRRGLRRRRDSSGRRRAPDWRGRSSRRFSDHVTVERQCSVASQCRARLLVRRSSCRSGERGCRSSKSTESAPGWRRRRPAALEVRTPLCTRIWTLLLLTACSNHEHHPRECECHWDTPRERTAVSKRQRLDDTGGRAATGLEPRWRRPPISHALSLPLSLRRGAIRSRLRSCPRCVSARLPFRARARRRAGRALPGED